MISKEEFLVLYEKNLSGACTPEEKQLLESYSDEIFMPDDQWDSDLGDKKRIYHLLKTNLKQNLPDTAFSKSSNRNTWIKVAAGIFMTLSVGLLFWNQQKPVNKPAYTTNKIEQKIVPGGNKAYLTMADGAVILLNEVKNGTLNTQTDVQINKVKDGILEYNHSVTSDKNIHQLSYNTINIPRGGEYQVVLSDGTKVWLNSASSLKYPAVFHGNERKVELSGEAYFEVAKNVSKPFHVVVNGINVQVLGTHFNIMSYGDDKEVKTTLLEGSVRLSGKTAAILLKPGQQAMLNEQQTAFNVKTVDVEDVIAWKNGLFAFNNEDIQTIMKRISRWYDVEVIFPENFRRRNFGGTISRFKDVESVLKSLELTGSIHFKIEGRRITVMP